MNHDKTGINIDKREITIDKRGIIKKAITNAYLIQPEQ